LRLNEVVLLREFIKRCNVGGFAVLGFAFCVLLFISGCQPASEAAGEMPAFPPNNPILPTATLLPPPGQSVVNPVIISTVAIAPASGQTFALPTPLPPETTTPIPVAAVATNIPPTNTPPPPTFTPPALPFTSNDEHYWFYRPAPDGSIVWTDKTYPYGSDRGGTLRPHHGVEFNLPYNSEVLAAASGRVVFAGNDDNANLGETPAFYGNVIVIQHDSQWRGQNIYTLYGHLNQVYVNEGQTVEARQLIGLSGATGVADGPHLHFEVRVGSNSYSTTRNPLLWLYPFPDRGTVSGRVIWPEGVPAEGVTVTLHRIDAETSQYYQTTTYTGTTVNGDNDLGENFVIDDVVAGYYQITVGSGAQKIKREAWVFEYRTTFEEFVLNGEDSVNFSPDE
jgi:murein DD-endopeptidase MepM/ murein hydrolase activator NlpD